MGTFALEAQLIHFIFIITDRLHGISSIWPGCSEGDTPYETNRSAADLQQICFGKYRSSAD